ncbi:MAG TPA: hypothetical protein PKL41_00905 [Flavobacteriales bacterium]|nr:hypothetical protein [Flavobacteriales bacterium]
MGHARVLENIGVYLALGMDYSWCTDPRSVVVVAEHAYFGVVGGVRLDIARPGSPLAMERLLFSMDPAIRASLSLLEPLGNAEICGLWNSDHMAGRGIPSLLTAAALSIAPTLGLHSVVSLSASYSTKYLANCGFEFMTNLGREGSFEFPIPGIHSNAMLNTDLCGLIKARPDQRQRILSLRTAPAQWRTESPKGRSLEVEYALMEAIDADQPIYRWLAEERLHQSA